MAMAAETSSSKGSASTEGLSDDAILSLASQVPHDKLHDLGVALGFSYVTVDHALVKHLRDIPMAATEVLMAWKKKHGAGREQRKALLNILESVGLGGLSSWLTPRAATTGLYSRESESAGLLASSGTTASGPMYRTAANASLSLSLGGMTVAGGTKDGLDVETCRKALINQYKDKKIQLKPWDRDAATSFADQHTTITLHTMDKGSRGIDEPKKVHIQDSINGIFKTKVKGQLPCRILLVGPAGYGKTTTLDKLSHDWAIGAPDSPLRDVSLLFALKCRQMNRNTSLGQAIKSQLLRSLQKRTNVTPDDIERLIEDNADKCLVLVDGYDEFSGSILLHKSSLVQLIRGDVLAECRALVTSRPNRKDDFTDTDIPKSFAVMEIEGFSPEDSDNYIKRFFHPDQSKADELNEHIKHCGLTFLIKVPFFCMVICTLWQTGLLKGTLTLTTVMTGLIKYLVHHALAKKAPSDRVDKHTFETDCVNALHALGKVALKCMLTDSDSESDSDSHNTVFGENEFEKCQREMQFAIDWGILITNPSINESVETFELSQSSIEFMHKLLQEYSTGIYLGKLDQKNQIAALRSIASTDKVLQFENVLRFAVGSSSQSFLPIMQHIISLKWPHHYGDTWDDHRHLLDFLSELPSAALDDAASIGGLASILHSYFTETGLQVKSANSNTIRGLERLPEIIKQKITKITIRDTELDEALSLRLWSCLQSFTSLTSLHIMWSSLPLPPSPPPLPSVRELDTNYTGNTSNSYSGLIESLPGLSTLTVCTRDAERDIDQIAAGLTRGGGGEVTHIALHGWRASQRTVSAACMSRLSEAVRARTTRLHEISLIVLSIDEEDLVSLVEGCRSISTMRKITFWQCDVAHNGRLLTHLTHLHQPHLHQSDFHQPQGAIRVHVGEMGVYDYKYTIPHQR